MVPKLETKLLVKLAQRRRNRGLALVTTPARQRPLTAVGAQTGRAQGQQQRRPARGLLGLDEGDGDRGPLQRRRRFGGGQARERRTALCDIPAGGFIEQAAHPA